MYSYNNISNTNSELFFEKMLDIFENLPFLLIFLGLIIFYITILLIVYLRTGINYHKTLELYYTSKMVNKSENIEENNS